MSLVVLGRQCAQLLLQAGKISQATSTTHVQLENIQAKFKLWAEVIGLFATGHAGIDHRFRDDAESRDVLSSMLLKLKSTLEDVVTASSSSPEKIFRSNDDMESLKEDDKPPTEPSSPESSIDQDTFSDMSHEDDHLASSPITRIEEIITFLYRFLNVVKKADSKTDTAKVVAFKAKHANADDDADFETFIRWSIEREIPNSSAVSKQRLINAVVQTRWRILYKQRHHQKLSENVDDWFVDRHPDSVLGLTAGPKDENAASPQRFNTPTLTIQTEIQTKRLRFAPMSNTEASSVNRLVVPTMPKSSALSVITQSAVGRRSHLDVPPPPKAETGGFPTRLCPYCCMNIGSEIFTDPSRWIRHVVRDCSPYVCLFDDCVVTQQYVTINDWVEHMRWNHATSYRCKIPGHEKLEFDSGEAFEQHLAHDHHEDFRKSELPEIIKRAIAPSKTTFGGLIGQEKALNHPNLLICPLCGLNPVSDQNNSEIDSRRNSARYDEILRDHMAGHLETLALLSLPIDEMNSQASDQSKLGEKPRPANESISSLPLVRPVNLWNVEPYKSYDARASTAETVVSQGEGDGVLPNEDRAPALDKKKLFIWEDIVDEIHRSKIASHNVAGDKTWQCLRQYTAVTIISRWWRMNQGRTIIGQDMNPIDAKTVTAAISIQQAYRDSKKRSTEPSQHKRARQLWDVTLELLRHERKIFPMIQSWLENCVTNHPLCEAAVTPFTPTRLIDVKPEFPCIVYGNSVSDCKYLALSWAAPSWEWHQFDYCPKLTTATVESWKRDITPKLPQLWLDAINLTKALGFRYLWIDALCIIQDHNADWKHEASFMRRIYDGATIVIAAANAASTKDSLFAPNKAPHVHFSEYSQFGKERWRSRVWTYQDELLSVRLLNFEMTEIVWRCRTAERCECTDWKYLSPENNKSTPTLLREWRKKIVTEYTQRQSSMPSDRLVALADVATSYARRIEKVSGSKPTYLAGIWLEDLLPSLCWFNQRDYDHFSHRHRPAGPSWSWGAIDDPVDFSEITYFDAIELPQYSIDHTSLSGIVRSGSLTVKGYLLEVNIHLQLSPHTWEPVFTSVSFRRDSDQQWRLKLPEKTESQSADPYVSTAVYENYNNAKFDVNIDNVSEADLCFMPFGFDWNGNNPPIEFHGLLLRKLPDGTHERVGYVEQRVPQNNPSKLRIMSSNLKLSELGEVVEIKIV